jgi:hypothetical protein
MAPTRFAEKHALDVLPPRHVARSTDALDWMAALNEADARA